MIQPAGNLGLDLESSHDLRVWQVLVVDTLNGNFSA
jgi:hypothetical protein